MKNALLLSLCLLAAPAALAEDAPHVSVAFRGTLHDALREIADKGHVNLVITSPLDQHADVYLKDIPVDQALQSVAGAYHLAMEQHGNVWTVRPETTGPTPTPAPKALAPPLPPTPPTFPTLPTLPPPPTVASPPTVSEDDGDADDSDKDDKEEKDDGDTDQTQSPSAPTPPQLHINMHRHHGDNDYVVTGPGDVAEGTTVGDCVSLGGGLTIEGECTGDAVAMGGRLDIKGHVGGDANAMGGSVHLFPNASVDGDVQALGGRVIRDEGSSVGGAESHVRRAHVPHITKVESESSAVSSFFLRFALLFAVGFLSMIFAPNRMRQIELELKHDPVRCGLTGMVGILALIALTFLLCITVIGIPFAVLMWLLIGLGLAMGVSAVASEIGLRLPFFRTRKTQALVLAVGLVVLLVAGMIPWLGPFAMSMVGLISLGAIIRTRFGAGRRQGIPERLEAPVGA